MFLFPLHSWHSFNFTLSFRGAVLAVFTCFYLSKIRIETQIESCFCLFGQSVSSLWAAVNNVSEPRVWTFRASQRSLAPQDYSKRLIFINLKCNLSSETTASATKIIQFTKLIKEIKIILFCVIYYKSFPKNGLNIFLKDIFVLFSDFNINPPLCAAFLLVSVSFFTFYFEKCTVLVLFSFPTGSLNKQHIIICQVAWQQLSCNRQPVDTHRKRLLTLTSSMVSGLLSK